MRLRRKINIYSSLNDKKKSTNQFSFDLNLNLSETSKETPNQTKTGEILWNEHSKINPENPVVNIHHPFINKSEVLKMLKQGVTLDKKSGKSNEKSRLTFMNKEFNDYGLRERRMTKQEYNSLCLSQAENYATERINERMMKHQSNLTLNSNSVCKDYTLSKTPVNFRLSINTEETPNMSINEDFGSQSIFESTPRFKLSNYLSHKIKSRNRNKDLRSVMLKSSLDKITLNGKDSK